MRRLGVGATSGGDRPLRAQLVVAFVIVLVLIAVPLYLVRRPSGKATSPAASASASASALPAAEGLLRGADKDAGKNDERLKIGSIQRVKCGSSPTNAPNQGNLCDSLPFFEDALKKAVLDTLDCAPKVKEAGSINYVLTIDFPRKKLHVYPGASGSWQGKQARRAAGCVKRALPVPDWGSITHQYRFYSIALMANYDPPVSPSTPKAPPGTPTFE